MLLKVFLIFALILKLCSSISSEVTIKLGTIRGALKTYNGKKVNEFLGIPYAKPPVGELRFKKPQPLSEAWKEDLIADQWPNVCAQSDLFGMKKFNAANESEDCLYLNIWTPGNLEETIVEPKAVLVYIHGGCFLEGTSSMEMLNGTTLAAKGDIV
ncbi:acetylcholinesterase-2-like protein, partial [Dinothrombium tinctorium]